MAADIGFWFEPSAPGDGMATGGQFSLLSGSGRSLMDVHTLRPSVGIRLRSNARLFAPQKEAIVLSMVHPQSMVNPDGETLKLVAEKRLAPTGSHESCLRARY